MSIGIVSDSEFELEWKRLNGIEISDSNSNSNSDNESDSNTDTDNEDTGIAEITSIERGRGEGKLQVPDSLRKVISQDAIENGNGSAIELAGNLGISKSSVSAYKNGAHSTTNYNEGNQDLKDHTNRVRDKITSKARARLLMAMGAITKEKLDGAKLRDVASVASAMSNVIRNMEPEKEAGNNQTNFIFYAPKSKPEEAFEVINVKE